VLSKVKTEKRILR